MENDNIYDYFDDGNLRIDSVSCCSSSCNSKLNSILKDAPKEMDSFKEVYDEFMKMNGEVSSANDKMGSNMGKLQEDLDNVVKAIDDIKNSCFHSEHHHFDAVLNSLKDIKFELNCEFAKRAHDMLKMEERVKKLEVDFKYLDLLRLTKIEEVLKKLIKENIDNNSKDSSEKPQQCVCKKKCSPELENEESELLPPDNSVNTPTETIDELFAKLEE